MLHVTQPVAAGVAEVVAALVEYQVGTGWDVAVACPSEGPLAGRVTASGARHIPWDARRAPNHRTIGEVRGLARTVRDFEPQLVHLHSSKSGLAGRLAIRGRCPTMFQPHAWSFLAVGAYTAVVVRWLERRLARYTHLTVCGSEDERRVGLEAGLRGPWVVIPNSVDVDEFRGFTDDDRRQARRSLGLDDSPLVVCIGRLCPQKGQDILLDAWPRVLAEVPTALLVLVGDGPDESTLADRNTPRTLLAGWSDDVSTWLAAADVAAQPSRYETLSLATLEAMASARSVVVSDAGGTHEAITPSCGAVVPSDDPQALAAAITERLTNPDLAATEGMAARRHVSAHFARSSWARRICDTSVELAEATAGCSVSREDRSTD